MLTPAALSALQQEIRALKTEINQRRSFHTRDIDLERRRKELQLMLRDHEADVREALHRAFRTAAPRIEVPPIQVPKED